MEGEDEVGVCEGFHGVKRGRGWVGYEMGTKTAVFDICENAAAIV